MLFEFFLEKYNRKMSVTRARRRGRGRGAPRTYDFPGNIRELENMVEQAVALSGGGVISVDDMLPARSAAEARRRRPAAGRSPTSSTAAERQAIEAALREHDGSREKAAECSGISATTLWRKMTRLAITYPPQG